MTCLTQAVRCSCTPVALEGRAPSRNCASEEQEGEMVLEPAGSSDLPVGRRCNFPVESLLQKYFASPVGQIISTNSRHPVPLQGRIAIVTDAGWDAVDAAASGVKRDAGRVRLRIRERSNGALTNDVASVRRSRVVLTPRRWRQVRGCYVGPTGLRHNVSPWTTVATSPVTGESAKETVKTIACGNAG
jgi:hypothetical protein